MRAAYALVSSLYPATLSSMSQSLSPFLSLPHHYLAFLAISVRSLCMFDFGSCSRESFCLDLGLCNTVRKLSDVCPATSDRCLLPDTWEFLDEGTEKWVSTRVLALEPLDVTCLRQLSSCFGLCSRFHLLSSGEGRRGRFP